MDEYVYSAQKPTLDVSNVPVYVVSVETTVDQLWDETQGIIHMDNSVVFPLFQIIFLEEGHGLSKFFHEFNTKYYLLVVVGYFPHQIVDKEMQIDRMDKFILKVTVTTKF